RLLAQRGEVDVVVDEDRHPEARAHGAQRVQRAVGGHVVGKADAAGVAIHHAGSGDGDGKQAVMGGAAALDGSGDDVGELGGQRPAAGLGGRLELVVDHLPEHVGSAGADVGPAEVQADDEAGVVTHDVGHRAAAAAAVLGADGRDHPRLLQTPDSGADRRLGQPRGRRDLRASDRTAAEDGFQHGLFAQLAQQAQTRVRGLSQGRRRCAVRVAIGHCHGFLTNGLDVLTPQNTDCMVVRSSFLQKPAAGRGESQMPGEQKRTSRCSFTTTTETASMGLYLAACGGSSSSSSSAGGASSSAATSGAAATSSASGPVTLNNLFQQQAGYSAADLAGMTKLFEQANPNIKVNNTLVAYEALHDKIVAAAPAGTYDVV